MGCLAMCCERHNIVWLLRTGETTLEVARGLANAMFVLDKRDAHIIVAMFTEADARRHRHIRVLYQQLGEFERAQMPKLFWHRGPCEHRGCRRRNLPAGARKGIDQDVAALAID